MARPVAHFLRLLALFLVLTSAFGCSTNVYVRAPGVCPRDPECLAYNQPDVASDAARERQAAYVQRVVSATVTVRAFSYGKGGGKSVSTGTGTLIGSKGYIITAYHLLQGAEMITVTLREPTKNGGFKETREMMATPLISSRGADMTLLTLPGGSAIPPPLTIRHDHVIVADRVWFLGDHGPLNNGNVVQIGISTNETASFADADIPSKPLDNGAPVLNVCGELVGVALGPYGNNGRLRFLPISDALASLGVTKADLR